MSIASTKLAACAVAALAAVGFSATAAHAANTSYTPNGGPKADFVGSSVSFTDTNAGQTLTCSQFDLAGSITNPGVSRAYGSTSPAGSLGTLTSSGCTNPTAGATTVAPSSTWSVAIDGDATGTVWPAELDNVQATVTAAGCTFTVLGSVTGTFDTSNQKFTPNGGGSLAINDNPSGLLCGLIGVSNGDPITVGGSWTNTPPSGSTAVSITNP